MEEGERREEGGGWGKRKVLRLVRFGTDYMLFLLRLTARRSHELTRFAPHDMSAHTVTFVTDPLHCAS